MNFLSDMGRIVVKIGSSLLVDSSTGLLNRDWLLSLCADISSFCSRGIEIIVVSSGSIALGRCILGMEGSLIRLEDSQGAAAVGQISLAHGWSEALAHHDIKAAQILLTLQDTEARRRYLNARGTLLMLLKHGVVPVINENDTVATSEMRYGDNDRLAARVSVMMEANCLILLSDVDGLYNSDPDNDEAHFISEIEDITPEIISMGSSGVSFFGSGGMASKIEAAQISTRSGCHMIISRGTILHPLRHIESGDRYSWFKAHGNPPMARKRWIMGALNPSGRILIDSGALLALRRGRSLLPAGVTGIEGHFSRGDTVSVISPDNMECARGLVAYDDIDALKIMGRRSEEIECVLGYSGRKHMVHRDDLVFMGKEEEV